MPSHAALGVVRGGVAVLKGADVRINCISPGQTDVGVSLNGFDMRGMTAQLPPAKMQSAAVEKANIRLERAELPERWVELRDFWQASLVATSLVPILLWMEVQAHGPYMSKFDYRCHSHGLKECPTSLKLVLFIPFLCYEDLAQGM
jgi:hypothetical protein